MKIALIGLRKKNGEKKLSSLPLAAKHEVVLRIDKHTEDSINNIGKADVAIEFQRAGELLTIISLPALMLMYPSWLETTGWYDKFEESEKRFALKRNQALFLFLQLQALG